MNLGERKKKFPSLRCLSNHTAESVRLSASARFASRIVERRRRSSSFIPSLRGGRVHGLIASREPIRTTGQKTEDQRCGRVQGDY